MVSAGGDVTVSARVGVDHRFRREPRRAVDRQGRRDRHERRRSPTRRRGSRTDHRRRQRGRPRGDERALDATADSKLEAFDRASASSSRSTRSAGSRRTSLQRRRRAARRPADLAAFNGAEQPSAARAWIRNTPVDAAGDVRSTATQASQLTATAGNEGVADAQLDGVLTKGSATDGVSGGGLLASNKVNTHAQAFVEFTGVQGTIEAGGDVTVVRVRHGGDRVAQHASCRARSSRTRRRDRGVPLRAAADRQRLHDQVGHSRDHAGYEGADRGGRQRARRRRATSTSTAASPTRSTSAASRTTEHRDHGRT